MKAETRAIIASVSLKPGYRVITESQSNDGDQIAIRDRDNALIWRGWEFERGFYGQLAEYLERYAIVAKRSEDHPDVVAMHERIIVATGCCVKNSIVRDAMDTAGDHLTDVVTAIRDKLAEQATGLDSASFDYQVITSIVLACSTYLARRRVFVAIVNNNEYRTEDSREAQRLALLTIETCGADQLLAEMLARTLIDREKEVAQLKLRLRQYETDL